ncbi:hypothetical protein [Streptomyces cyaneofuscatus]|uniref:hypothetical protein n=1 Tax=Streptomyces cyaneofuscatus TaxID=66883 RepID=UPI00339F51A3
MTLRLTNENQEDLLEEVARRITRSGDIIAGANYTLAHHGVRQNWSSVLEIYYSGNMPNVEDEMSFKEIVSLYVKWGMQVTLSKCPPLLYNPVPISGRRNLVGSQESLYRLSFEDAVGLKLGRLSVASSERIEEVRSAIPVVDDYYDLCQIVNSIGFQALDLMLAMNLHAANPCAIGRNLQRWISSGVCETPSGVTNQVSSPDDFRKNAIGFCRNSFDLAEAAGVYAVNYDNGIIDPTALRKVVCGYPGLQSLISSMPLSGFDRRRNVRLGDHPQTRGAWGVSSRARMSASVAVRDILMSMAPAGEGDASDAESVAARRCTAFASDFRDGPPTESVDGFRAVG